MRYAILALTLFLAAPVAAQTIPTHTSSQCQAQWELPQADFTWTVTTMDPCLTVWGHFLRYAAPLGVSRDEFIHRNARLWALAERGQLYAGVEYRIWLPRASGSSAS